MRVFEAIICWLVIFTAIPGAFILTMGCSLEAPITTFEHQLEDGRALTCLKDPPGLSCDWENAR